MQKLRIKMNKLKGITKRDFRNLVIGIAIGYFLMLSFLTIPNKFGGGYAWYICSFWSVVLGKE
jgi:hypothetical protein